MKMKNASPQAIVQDEQDLHWAKQMVALQALQADNESDDEYNRRSASGGVMRDLSVAQAQIVENVMAIHFLPAFKLEWLWRSGFEPSADNAPPW